MSQDRSTGATADAWGRQTGRAIALKLGATQFSAHGNEFVLSGKTTTIRCAAQNTPSVGVLNTMLARVDRVIAAFETSPRNFELWELTSQEYRGAMYPTRSKGRSAGLVSLVKRSVFKERGRKIGAITL